MIKDKHYEIRILYQVKILFTIKDQLDNFSDKQKLREFITNKFTVQKC